MRYHKLLSLLCMFLVTAFCLSACSSPQESPALSAIKEDEIYPVIGLELTVDTTTYPPVQNISWTIKNNGQDHVECDSLYIFEKYENEKWYSLYSPATSTRTSVLTNGDTFTERLIYAGVDLPSGKYRILKKLGGAYLSAEFEI